MSYQMQTVVNEAVFFFGQTHVLKEVLFSEFEAVLDGIVDMPELASQDWPAVYLQTNARLDVLSCVFFYIKFDEKGSPDRTWNMPLRHMADIAGVGPDMGVGPIRLSCRSQCPVPWHQSRSWDPIIQPEGNTFVAIRDALLDNRLALIVQEVTEVSVADVPVLTPLDESLDTSIEPQLVNYDYSYDEESLTPSNEHWDGQPENLSVVDPNFVAETEQTDSLSGHLDNQTLSASQMNAQDHNEPLQIASTETPPVDQSKPVDQLRSIDKPKPVESGFDRTHRDKAAKLIKKLRFQISTQETKRQDEMVALHADYSKDITSLNQEIEKLRLSLSLEQKKNLELKEHLSEQAAEYELAREQFVEQVEDSKQLEAKQIEGLKKKYELELKAKIEQELRAMKEVLDTREVELLYREEQITHLRQEVTELHEEKQDLLKQGGNNVLERVAKNGVTFVAFHPGVGHITIPLDQMGRYLESPTAFVAEKAFVTEEHYLAWLKHYHHSACTHKNSKGEPCLEPIKRVERPAEFIPGRSDRCGKHQTLVQEMASAVVKIN